MMTLMGIYNHCLNKLKRTNFGPVIEFFKIKFNAPVAMCCIQSAYYDKMSTKKKIVGQQNIEVLGYLPKCQPHFKVVRYIKNYIVNFSNFFSRARVYEVLKLQEIIGRLPVYFFSECKFKFATVYNGVQWHFHSSLHEKTF